MLRRNLIKFGHVLLFFVAGGIYGIWKGHFHDLLGWVINKQ